MSDQRQQTRRRRQDQRRGVCRYADLVPPWVRARRRTPRPARRPTGAPTQRRDRAPAPGSAGAGGCSLPPSMRWTRCNNHSGGSDLSRDDSPQLPGETADGPSFRSAAHFLPPARPPPAHVPQARHGPAGLVEPAHLARSAIPPARAPCPKPGPTGSAAVRGARGAGRGHRDDAAHRRRQRAPIPDPSAVPGAELYDHWDPAVTAAAPRPAPTWSDLPGRRRDGGSGVDAFGVRRGQGILLATGPFFAWELDPRRSRANDRHPARRRRG